MYTRNWHINIFFLISYDLFFSKAKFVFAIVRTLTFDYSLMDFIYKILNLNAKTIATIDIAFSRDINHRWWFFVLCFLLSNFVLHTSS